MFNGKRNTVYNEAKTLSVVHFSFNIISNETLKQSIINIYRIITVWFWPFRYIFFFDKCIWKYDYLFWGEADGWCCTSETMWCYLSLYIPMFPFSSSWFLSWGEQKKKKAEIEAINVFKVLDLDSDVYAPVIIAVPRELQSDVRVTSLLLSRTCIQYFKNEKKN